MSRRGHIPIRTCMGCATRGPQSTLVRVVLDVDRLRPDPARRADGRGGYLHPRAECWARFARRKGRVRSLGAAIDRPARAELAVALTALAGE